MKKEKNVFVYKKRERQYTRLVDNNIGRIYVDNYINKDGIH